MPMSRSVSWEYVLYEEKNELGTERLWMHERTRTVSPLSALPQSE